VLVGMLGAGEAEVPLLAELHRNPRVHVVAVYDPEPQAVGLELAEILGIPQGSKESVLQQLERAEHIVLGRDRERLAGAIGILQAAGVTAFVGANEAMGHYRVEKIVEAPRPTPPPKEAERRAESLEVALRWLNRALDREELLRSMLAIGLQAVGATKGSIQILDTLSNELYIGYASGLSDPVVRSSRQKIGVGISGSVAQRKRGRLLVGRVNQHTRPERGDIMSAICVPLLVDDRVLGVLNVSTDIGAEPLNKRDLSVVDQLSRRMAPVLGRLLEIQAQHERALVDDLQQELLQLLSMELDPAETLAVIRDLLQDLSGAGVAQLVLLNVDGSAVRVRAGRLEGGGPRIEREPDPHRGILGQVLLGTEPVFMEERIRPAGETIVRRHLTLYLPVGEPETFAVFIAHFEGLSVLSHFQRSMDAVRTTLASRLGELMAREDRRGRMQRLRLLVSGLSTMAGQGRAERAATAAHVFLRQCEAEVVALWMDSSVSPTVFVSYGELQESDLRPVWPAIRARLESAGSQRLTELDEGGSALRTLLLAGSVAGPAIVAINRRPSGILESAGFREEDEEASRALLDALGAPAEESGDLGRVEISPVDTPSSSAEGDFARNEKILRDTINRELSRAQRYHFGFSLSIFEIDFSEEQRVTLADALEHRMRTDTRATDCVLWLAPNRFAILAPEEARGQRRLARRIQSMLVDFFDGHAASNPPVIRVGSAIYPQQADSPEDLIAMSLRHLGGAAD
jgi:GAF domain-containing protein